MHGGLELSQARKLNQLEEENTTFKRLVVDLSLDKVMLQDGLRRVASLAQRRDMIGDWETALRGERAMGLVDEVLQIASLARGPTRTELRDRIREIARTRVSYGYGLRACAAWP